MKTGDFVIRGPNLFKVQVAQGKHLELEEIGFFREDGFIFWWETIARKIELHVGGFRPATEAEVAKMVAARITKAT